MVWLGGSIRTISRMLVNQCRSRAIPLGLRIHANCESASQRLYSEFLESGVFCSVVTSAPFAGRVEKDVGTFVYVAEFADITQVEDVFRTLFRWTSPSLISAYTTNTLGNNVACDMPGQIPCMSWLILIMPLSTSMLNCAISFWKRRARELFHSNRSV